MHRPHDDDHDPGRSWERALLPGLVLLFAAAAGASATTPPLPPDPSLPRDERPPGPPPRRPLVELRLAEVVQIDGVRGGALLLEDTGRTHVMPLFVETPTADDVRRHGPEEAPRGVARLLGAALGRLGGRVERVELVHGPGGELTGRVVLGSGEEELVLDASAEEAVGLAIGLHAPLFADQPALDEHAIRRTDAEQAEPPAPAKVRPSESL